jgi:hypothetical protein
MKHLDLLYSALDLFLEDDSTDVIIRDEQLVLFRTTLGLKGAILSNQKGDKSIMIGNEVVYTIERSVFDLISYGVNVPPIEVYLPRLIMTWQSDIQPKSKILIGKIIKGLSQMIISGILNVDFESEFGKFTFQSEQKTEVIEE